MIYVLLKKVREREGEKLKYNLLLDAAIRNDAGSQDDEEFL
jgi:hypothetical protein